MNDDSSNPTSPRINSTTSEAAVVLSDLDLEAGDKSLLEQAHLSVDPGEMVLLVGMSGSGKSLTLRLLLDLLPNDGAIRTRGTVELFGEPAATAARQRAGIVFQDFGLFDEWNVRENILFGHDHRRRNRHDTTVSRDEVANRLTTEFGLPPATRVAVSSGGMKQRTALARTLAYDPDLLLYDEPTSGLDPAMSRRVAERIRRTNDEHGKTSIVVTHDVEALRQVADRIVVLDPITRGFRDVATEDVDDVLATLTTTGDDDAVPRRRPFAARAKSFLTTTGQGVVATVEALFYLIPRWPRLRWGARYLWYYLRLSTFGSALAYVGVAGFILGLIVTWFTFSFLPFREYTEPILIDRVIGAIGFALYRVLAPGMTAMLIAARSGAAVAADTGNRVYTKQTEALRSFGVEPKRYILTNILLAHLIGTPILLAVNYLTATLGSLMVFIAVHPELSTYFWSTEFFRDIETDGFFFKGTDWLAAKALVSSLGVATIAAFFGLRPKASGRDVSAAVTSAIIWATLFALMVQVVVAFLEFEPV